MMHFAELTLRVQ